MGAPVGNTNALKHGLGASPVAGSQGTGAGDGTERGQRNALRDELDAAAVSVPNGELREDPEKVTGLVEDFAEQFRPATKLEHALVRRLAIATLRHERLTGLEAQMIAAMLPGDGVRVPGCESVRVGNPAEGEA